MHEKSWAMRQENNAACFCSVLCDIKKMALDAPGVGVASLNYDNDFMDFFVVSPVRAPARPRVRGASALSAKVPAGLLPHNILHLLQVLAREALPGVGARLFAHGEREKPGDEDGEKRERERQREEREKEKGQPVGNEILFGLTCSARRTFFGHWRIVGSCRRPTRRCSCPCPSLRRRRDEKKKKVGRVREKERVREGPAPRTRQERPPHHLFPIPAPALVSGGRVERERERERRGGGGGGGGGGGRKTHPCS